MKTLIILAVLGLVLYFTGKKFIRMFTKGESSCGGCSKADSCHLKK